MIDVLLKGDFSGKPFPFPQVEIKLDPKMVNKARDEYLSACELATRFGSPRFLNMFRKDILPWHCSVESLLVVDGSGEQPASLRGGVLQEVTINLPNVAYESRGRESRMHDLILERMALAKSVLMLKKDLMESRMKEGSLGFAAQRIGQTRRLEIDRQQMLFGIVGMNEAVKSMTGSELHESDEASSLALEILHTMADFASECSKETGMMFAICQSPSLEAGNRLARIDRREFRRRFVGEGEVSDGSVFYTDGAQVRASADIPLEERLDVEARFHPLLGGGAAFNVWLADVPEPEVVWKQALRMAETGVGLFGFTQDLTLCMACGAASPGLSYACRSCRSEEVDWISRVGGEVSRVGIRDEIGGWNAGSRRQLLNRKRYRI